MDAAKLGEIFFNDNYSIELLLNKTREHGLSLGELRQSLAQYQQDLNQNSLELFNNNYDRFYKLSYIISCLNEPIQNLTEPIVTFRNKVAQVCRQHDEYLNQVNEKLASLESTSKNKELSRRLIELIKRRDRIEEQVGNIDWSVRALDLSNSTKQRDAASARDQDIVFQTKCDLLERVSVELYHLIIEVGAMKPTQDELIPIKNALEISLDERIVQIDQWFEGAFLEAVELQDKTLIELVVRTYQQKSALNRIDDVWRKKVFKPYLDLTVTDNQLTKQITRTYGLLTEFLRRSIELIGSKFIVKSFWLELVNALDRLTRLYSLDDLDTFRVHYEETRKFLNEQDQYVSETTQEPIFRFPEDLVLYNKRKILNKFNLKGYFNHRLSQMASSVESSLTSSPLSEILNHSATSDSALTCFKIKICMHIYVLITKCWSPELYIDTLEMNFTQLACRILNRFSDWLSKLRLSDFRITGPSSLDKQTNFLAKQDAIMRLLLEDCDRLAERINQYFTSQSLAEHTGLEHSNPNFSTIKKELIQESLKTLKTGLNNVQSLQRLIER